MTIPTLTNTSILYHINRNRDFYQRELDKRKAAVLTVAIFAVLTIGVLVYILQ